MFKRSEEKNPGSAPDPDLTTKFHGNPLCSFCVILVLTNKPTNQQTMIT